MLRRDIQSGAHSRLPLSRVRYTRGADLLVSIIAFEGFYYKKIIP